MKKINNIVSLKDVRSNKYKEIADMCNLALYYGKKEARECSLNKIQEEYKNMNIISRDIIEAFMIDCANVANDIYFMVNKEEIEIEDAVFKSDVVRKTDEGHAFTIDGVNELTHLKNINDPLAEEIGMYVTLLRKLMEEKYKVEEKIKKDLLSEQNLNQMEKYHREFGIKFDKEEVKQSIEEMLVKYGVVYLLKNNYIS